MPRNVHITIAPTMLDDLPALAECELLAFSGYNNSGDSDKTNKYAQLSAPFRAPLARSKIAPRLWPDYEAIIRKRRAQLLEGTMRYFTARVHEPGDDVEDGKGETLDVNELGPDGIPVNRSHFRRGRIVGLLTLEPPATQVRAKRANKSWAGRLLSDYIYPTLSILESKMPLPFGLGSNAVNGWDHAFLRAAKDVLRSGRTAFSEHWECFIIHILFVHPDYQRHGVGRALLSHAVTLADSAHIPLYVEASTVQARNFYVAQGFSLKQTLDIRYKEDVVQMSVMVHGARGSIHNEDEDRGADDGGATPTTTASIPVFKDPQ